MRLAILGTLAVSACHVYDPVDDVPHREFDDTQSAIEAILDEAPVPQVYAVGEYHETKAGRARRSPLARFTSDIVTLLVPHAHHLVVEAWLSDSCGSRGESVGAQVAAVTGRSPSTKTELQQLIGTSQELRLVTHGLPMTCIEHGSVLDGYGRVDFLRLLELVTEKLHDTAANLVGAGRGGVIVYGGALHNDLYPRWPLADLSYAEPLAKELGDGEVLELDLVVPEIVAPMAIVRLEPWFPRLARSAPGRVIVWQRAASSYVVILPAQNAEVAKVASIRSTL